FTVLLVLVSGYTASQLSSIGAGWGLVLEIGFGTGAVYILRWYWSRINAWSEISAMIAAAAVTLGLRGMTFSGSDAVVYAKRSLITAGITTAAWLLVTFFTPEETEATLTSFYRRVHPAVYGWKRIAKLMPELPEVRHHVGYRICWLLRFLLAYCVLF